MISLRKLQNFMLLSISSRSWDVLANIFYQSGILTNCKPLILVFNTQPGLERETAVQNSKGKQKGYLTEKNTNPRRAITRAFWWLVYWFGPPKKLLKNLKKDESAIVVKMCIFMWIWCTSSDKTHFIEAITMNRNIF